MTTQSEASTPVDQWRDKKRYLWLIGLVVPSLAAQLSAAMAGSYMVVSRTERNINKTKASSFSKALPLPIPRPPSPLQR